MLCKIFVAAEANVYRLSAYLAITCSSSILLVDQYDAALINSYQLTSRLGATASFFQTSLGIKKIEDEERANRAVLLVRVAFWAQAQGSMRPEVATRT